MKYNLPALVLTFCLFTGNASSQDVECTFCAPKRQTKTQANFNATYINHRHIVALEKGNKMIVEMFNITDYDQLQNIGDVLTAFQTAIKPLEDSLETTPSGHLRIDYAYSTGADYKKIRIKKYSPEGDMFITGKGNNISRLKVEQDTVRILIEKMATYTYGGVEYKNHRPVQLTLVLNNYTDIDGLIKNKETIQHFIDTMKLAATPKGKVWQQNYKTTINFHPYPGAPERFSGKYRFIFMEGIVSDEYAPLAWVNRYVFPRTFAFVADMGGGLVRSKIAPAAEAGFEYRFPWTRGGDYITIARVTVSSYFLFDKSPEGRFNMYDTWFVNAEIGTLFREKDSDFSLMRETIGIGYLLTKNSPYLPGTTVKAYLNFPIKNQFSICPELIATNDFKTIFPAFTFKGFFNRD